MNKKYIVGFLTVLILLSGVAYITLSDEVRIRVDDDKATFYVPHEAYSWIWTVSGREMNKLFDGTSLMYRDAKNIKINTTINGNRVLIRRETPYIRGPVIIDTYTFNGDVGDKKLFPISHEVEIYNASGKFFRYEVRDLVYDGLSIKLTDETSMSFGRKMKVEWQEDYRWAWVYKDGLYQNRQYRSL